MNASFWEAKKHIPKKLKWLTGLKWHSCMWPDGTPAKMRKRMTGRKWKAGRLCSTTLCRVSTENRGKNYAVSNSRETGANGWCWTGARDGLSDVSVFILAGLRPSILTVSRSPYRSLRAWQESPREAFQTTTKKKSQALEQRRATTFFGCRRWNPILNHLKKDMAELSLCTNQTSP